MKQMKAFQMHQFNDSFLMSHTMISIPFVDMNCEHEIKTAITFPMMKIQLLFEFL